MNKHLNQAAVVGSRNEAVHELVSLRLAETSDEAFLSALYAETRRDELALLDWNAEQQAAFCQMQFRLQSRAYRMQFPDAVRYIIEFGNQAIGRLIVSRSEAEIRLVDISILLEFRNRGAGTILVSNLQSEAQNENKPLNLSVLKTNSAAIRLYEKLGFAAVESNETHFTMRWRKQAKIKNL